MKRSHMLDYIEGTLACISENKTRREIAEAVLKEIEIQGMSPPFMDIKSATEGDYVTLHVSDAAYAGKLEWEDES